MANFAPSSELRQLFAGAVDDQRSEEFLHWLAQVDGSIREISGGGLDLCDVTNPGWLELWEQDATIPECIDAVRALDFVFDGFWELHNDGKNFNRVG